jgi:hypothetical protein
MGTCSNTNKHRESKFNSANTEVKCGNSSQAPEIESVMDMPEWEGERYKGEGIKRMKGYKCNLPINELNKLRDEFWNKKVAGNHLWKSIKQACVMDHIRSGNVLATIGLEPQNNCINVLKDKKGKIYKIPNFCINDPYFEKIIDCEKRTEDMRKAEVIKIKLYNLYVNTHHEISVPDNINGRELKSIFATLVNLQNKENKIRLFFGGAEILDEHRLYMHHIKNDYTVQVIVETNCSSTT